MKNNYTYPVILDKSEEGMINIYFPDFENMVTCIEDGGNYVEEAQDYLAMVITDYEDCGKSLPEPSLAEKIQLKTIAEKNTQICSIMKDGDIASFYSSLE